MIKYGLLLKSLSAIAVLAAAIESIGTPAFEAISTTLVVTNPADSGTGTLRQKMLEAQSGDTIIFDPGVFPPANPKIIYAQSPLPTLVRDNQTIDASNAGVILDGSQAPAGTNGFIISAVNCVIRGLTIRNFSSNGIILTLGAANNILGGDRTVGNGPNHEGNTIISNGGSGIDIRGTGTNGNFIQGNYIGVDGSGLWGAGNLYNGIAIWQGASNNTVGGASDGYRNIISGNRQNGIWIAGAGADQNKVLGNYIGTRADGTEPIGNGYSGIALHEGAQFNRIGGTLASERNIISGNHDNGMYISDAGTSNNQVLGNLIGTNSTGAGIIGQGTNGIVIINGATNTIVGDGTPNGRNLISGNTFDGIRIDGITTTNNTVQGNFISTNISGTGALPNGLHGVELTNSTHNNLVGGNRFTGQGNLISGDGNHGVIINFGAHHNQVAGNLIGPDITGMVSLGNHPFGAIDIADEAHHNTIGGVQPGEGNIISGNQTDGIALFDNLGGGTTDNEVIGNIIGLAVDGTTPLPNAHYGIFNVSGTKRTVIMSNTIAYEDYGIWITECAGNTITQNSIYSNTFTGIVIEHTCMSAPQITATTTTTLTGVTSPTARVEFFSSDDAEGRLYEGSVMADASGNFTFAKPTGFTGPNVTATSTDADGNTSAFSKPVHLLWTLLIYLNGDNDLEDALHDTLNNLVAAGSSSRANVLVLIDGYTNTEYYTGTALLDITDGQAISIATQLGPTLTVPSELNMGDGQTLVEFVAWGRVHYPARHTLLSIVDHGGGWAPSLEPGPEIPGALKHHHSWLAGNSGLSWDFTNGYDYLDSNEIRRALAAISVSGTNKLDVVFYDVCLMGMMEVAYQIKDYASYFVSSQNIGWAPVGADGRYVRIVHSIGSATTPRQMAELLVQTYADSMPPNEHPFTVSAVDLQQLPVVTSAINQLGLAISQTLADSTHAETLHSAYASAQKIDYDGDFQIEPATDGFVDLYDFALHAAQQFADAAIISSARAVTTALDTAVVAEKHQSGAPWMAPDRFWDLNNVHGLSIFLPLGEDLELQYVITETSPITPDLVISRNLHLREMYSSDQLQFVGATSWKALIDAYYHVVASPVPTNTTSGPVQGLQNPDVIAPQSLMTIQGKFTAGQSITLTWTAVDTQTGVISATLWHRVPSGSWSHVSSQFGTAGSFTYTLPFACQDTLAVRAVDAAGNIEAFNSGANTTSVSISPCMYFPILAREYRYP
jgi:parallel beta-helix repeat protein